MIEAHNLSRRYGDFTAVHDVSFAVKDREILGILGPNGAGKTTTIRMITGFLPPTTGRVTVAGKDLFAAPREARRQLGYLPENVALYNEMRVEEYLAYRARLEGLSTAEARGAIEMAIERCLVDEVRHQIIGTLSKGYRQRVGLATAILHSPSVLVLDEPTVGLDPKQIISIRELIRELGRERTLLLSTHILPEVELLCDRVVIIDRGSIVAEGTPADLRERWVGNPGLRIAIKDAPAEAKEVLAHVHGVLAIRPGAEAGSFVVEHERGTDLREEVFRIVVARGWVLLELVQERATLEDVFVRLTTRDAAADPADAANPADPANPADTADDATGGPEAQAPAAASEEVVS